MRLGYVFVLGGCALGAGTLWGCSSGGDDSTGTAGSGGGGNAACKSTDPSCYVAGPDGPGNECMAKADFASSDVTSLRMSSHQVQSPAALALPFMQDAIITKRSTLNEQQCNMLGSGTFNLLLSIDTKQKSVSMGGGVPQDLLGPATGGTCWADFTDAASGIHVQKVSTSYTENAGTFTANFDNFAMPIYLENKTTSDSYVIVPLHQITLTGKLSADKDCIGRYAAERLSKDFSCQPGEGEFAWDTGGKYEGYITVTEADNVTVVTLGESLCVVLTGDPKTWKGTDSTCKTSSGFQKTGGLPKGDWCSTTNSAGGCQDSWKLVIDYAAQAINVKGVYDEAKGGC